MRAAGWLGVALLSTSPLFAADLTPDIFNARAALEEKVVQKYRTELSTLLPKDTFAVTAQVSLVEKTPGDAAASEGAAPSAEYAPFDLRMGRLNPKSWGATPEKGSGPVYAIRSVSLLVGLDSYYYPHVAARFIRG